MKGKKPSSDTNVGSRQRRASKNEAPAANQVLSVENPAVFQIEKPVGMSKLAAEHWDDLVPRLLAAKLLCSLDIHILAEFCETAAQVQELKKFLKKEGYFFKQSNGIKVLRPEYKLCDSLQKKLIKFSDCLGLSPSARKRMGIALQLKSPAENMPKCLRWELSGDDTCKCQSCETRRL